MSATRPSTFGRCLSAAATVTRNSLCDGPTASRSNVFSSATQSRSRAVCGKSASTTRFAVTLAVASPRCRRSRVIWKKDAALLTQWGGDTLTAKQDAEGLGGVVDYPYKHRIGPDGKLERVPLEIYKPAPGALRQHVARSLLPSEYNPP